MGHASARDGIRCAAVRADADFHGHAYRAGAYTHRAVDSALAGVSHHVPFGHDQASLGRRLLARRYGAQLPLLDSAPAALECVVPAPVAEIVSQIERWLAACRGTDRAFS